MLHVIIYLKTLLGVIFTCGWFKSKDVIPLGRQLSLLWLTVTNYASTILNVYRKLDTIFPDTVMRFKDVTVINAWGRISTTIESYQLQMMRIWCVDLSSRLTLSWVFCLNLFTTWNVLYIWEWHNLIIRLLSSPERMKRGYTLITNNFIYGTYAIKITKSYKNLNILFRFIFFKSVFLLQFDFIQAITHSSQ